MYNYRAKVIRIIDGDTADISIDLGFGVTYGTKKQPIRVRLYGIDAPETRTRNLKEKARGLRTKQFIIDILKDKVIYVDTHKGKGKYGRWLAVIFYKDPDDGIVNLNKLLVQKKLAKEYFGGKR